ncbi:hypothetical protein LshimejAT787_0701630 [Lyophyllum shimeji]|uniref:G domain-containing protein n=1 Tax=Lyophyllum shimeji TaxID=47721 RepID=A0A9P3UNG6_LYOSH|nr:hypothetical protein LshimejAT787_0701630 [Lyophyllum shimeji]
MAPKRRSTRKTKSSEVAQPTSTTTAEAQHDSTCLFQGSDTIVLILGQTGAGKSTFINYALDSETAPLGTGSTHIQTTSTLIRWTWVVVALSS